MSETILRRALTQGHWEGVDTLHYKQAADNSFKAVTRQVLFDDAGGSQWRYFEVAAGGHTTLERHQHPHAVMILRGPGRCLVGDRIYEVDERDLVSVPPMTWHQFRAAPDSPLGFLCLVSRERDRPQLPTIEDLNRLRANPAIDTFIR